MPGEAFPAEPELRSLATLRESLKPLPLSRQQRDVADAICEVAVSRAHVTASVLGMTCAGKTRVLLEVRDRIEASGRKAILLSPNRRIAGSQGDSEFRSIYRHLYLDPDAAKQPGAGESTAGPAPEKPKGTIELRHCGDPADCVYLLDDAHLLGNSLFVTPDGCTYGSGKLLSDLFDFAGVPAGSRQLIFFGDPYQLQRASAAESVLSGSFQAMRNVSHRLLALDRPETAPETARLRNARNLVQAIETGNFSSLGMEEDEGFRIIGAGTAATELAERFGNGAVSARLVTDTNAQVSKFVRWLRPRLFSREFPASVEPGELLEVYAAVPGSGPGTEREFFAGQCHRVATVGNRRSVRQQLTGRSEPVRFALFDSLGFAAPGAEPSSVSTVLEDFIVAEKPELAADVAIAFRVWKKGQARCISEEGTGQAESGNPEQDETTGLPATLLRYGYASTVHHAQGNPVADCYVNCDCAGSGHSDAWFRWLYTALTTSRGSVTLFNFTPLDPFDSARWNASGAQEIGELAVGGGWSFNPCPDALDTEDSHVPSGIRTARNREASAAIWSRIDAAARHAGWTVNEVIATPCRDSYELSGPAGSARLSVAYSPKNRVTALHVKDLENWPLLCDIAAYCVAESEFTRSAGNLLGGLQTLVQSAGWRVVSASESDWLLTVVLARKHDERVRLDIHFDNGGLATSIRPRFCTRIGLLDDVRELFA